MQAIDNPTTFDKNQKLVSNFSFDSFDGFNTLDDSEMSLLSYSD